MVVAKKRNESDLIMHKLVGDHKMGQVTICTICGVTEGQEVIEPYEPIRLNSDQAMELMRTIMHLSTQIRDLGQKLRTIEMNLYDRDKRMDRDYWRRDYEPVPWKSPFTREAEENKTMTPDLDKYRKLLESVTDIDHETAKKSILQDAEEILK
jgi:hypothetical protein